MEVKTSTFRKLAIVDVADDMRQDSFDGNGLDLDNYEESNLFDVIEDCIGFKLTASQERLAVVAFENGSQIAKRSIWFQ